MLIMAHVMADCTYGWRQERIEVRQLLYTELLETHARATVWVLPCIVQKLQRTSRSSQAAITALMQSSARTLIWSGTVVKQFWRIWSISSLRKTCTCSANVASLWLTIQQVTVSWLQESLPSPNLWTETSTCPWELTVLLATIPTICFRRCD